MSKNIKDIEFAFFSQLAYLNWNTINLNKLKNENSYINKEFIKFLNISEVWNKIKIDNLEPKVEKGILMYDELDKRLFGVFGIEKNKENSQLINPLYNFDGWQFIYSADNTKLFKDRYKLEVENDGFFACAFMKDNDVIIAYRGTEPNTIEDLLADLEIGFLNHNHSQLVCAYMFIEHVKSLYPDKNIHITGHSLGGCLAQYAFVCTGKQYPTVTWNALGLGKHKNQVTSNIFWGNDITAYLDFYSMDIKRKLENSLFNKQGEINDDFLNFTEKQMTELIFNRLYKPIKESLESGYYKIAEKEVGYFKLSFGTVSSDSNRENQKLNSSQDEELKTKLKISSIHIYWLLRGIKNYQLSFKKSSNGITNFYNSLDWTADLQTREGKCVDVLTGEETEKEEIDDSKFRILSSTFSKIGFSYHGVNDFLIYMDKNGMVQAGQYNLIFTKNLIKTLYENILNADMRRAKGTKKLDFLKEGTTNKTEKEKPFLNFHTSCTKKPLFGNKQSEIEIAKILYALPAKNALSSDVAPYIPYREYEENERPNGSDEVGVFILGQVTNVTLCGIKGGDTIQLKKIGQPIQKQSLAEQVTEIKNKKEIDAGTCIGWGTKGGSTEYDVIKYSDGTIVRQPRYV